MPDFAPFGFGYRRCPGEQMTIDVFADFLRKVSRDKIVFHNLHQPRSWKGSGWAGRGDRRRHRVLAVGVSARVERRALGSEGAIAGSSMRARSMRPAKRLRTLASAERRGGPMDGRDRPCRLGARLPQRAGRHLASQL